MLCDDADTDVLTTTWSRYKLELGARMLPRAEFLREFRTAREKRPQLLSTHPLATAPSVELPRTAA
eukprot:COSAG01_NODE_5336_length_4326_cov_2.410457_4_plen_66_part_00